MLALSHSRPAHCAASEVLVGWLPVDDLLAIASAALGADLTEPADLGGSSRSEVVRCRKTDGGTVVVKRYPQTADGAESLTAEAAGLAFTSGAGVGPDLLAADAAARLIVMTDLGDAPSLADLLLGGTAGQARAALLDWAQACGQLAARTAGRRRELAHLRASYPAAGPAGQAAGNSADHWLQRRLQEVPGLLAGLGMPVPAGLAEDLDAIAGLVRPGGTEVFSPGDICPDNNLVTTAGVRFLDYESAEFHSVFLDAAYLRMPFSSCWCVFQLPPELASAAEVAYRAEVSHAFPELADDQSWQAGIRLAMAAWTLHAMTYLLDRSIAADAPMHTDVRPVPTARQLLRYRWRRLSDELRPAGELPAVTALADSLLASTEDWQVPDLPVYPALRQADHRSGP
jgi:hypothetical protein